MFVKDFATEKSKEKVKGGINAVRQTSPQAMEEFIMTSPYTTFTRGSKKVPKVYQTLLKH